jgi:ketopantoate reductase
VHGARPGGGSIQLRSQKQCPTTPHPAPRRARGRVRCRMPRAKSAAAMEVEQAAAAKGYKSCLRGVTWHKHNKKWEARISHRGTCQRLGSFRSEEDAARAYDERAREYRGARAELNFPEAGEVKAQQRTRSAAEIKAAEAAEQAAAAKGYMSCYRGVSWHWHQWRAEISINGKKHHLGRFDEEDDAARAYDEAAREHRGARAQLNLPRPGEPTNALAIRSAAEVRTAEKAAAAKGYQSCSRGVTWHKHNKKWYAAIRHRGTVHHIGSFHSEEDAARAYDERAREYRGAQAELNFPEVGEVKAQQFTRSAAEIKAAEQAAAAKGYKSHYRGLYWHTDAHKWVARASHDGKLHSLGAFSSEEDAARAYDEAAREHHGARAQLNFPRAGEVKAQPCALRSAAELRAAERAAAITDFKSGFCGVCWSRSHRKWAAAIHHDGKSHHVGYFSSEEDAARAYDEAAREHHGARAQLNFPRAGEVKAHPLAARSAAEMWKAEGVVAAKRYKRSAAESAAAASGKQEQDHGCTSEEEEEEEEEEPSEGLELARGGGGGGAAFGTERMRTSRFGSVRAERRMRRNTVQVPSPCFVTYIPPPSHECHDQKSGLAEIYLCFAMPILILVCM